MMISPDAYRNNFEKASLKEILKERDALIREIRRYEKGKIPEEDYLIIPDPETVYLCNNLYLAELCYLIEHKMRFPTNK